jgi:predicted HTH domain antitoxin
MRRLPIGAGCAAYPKSSRRCAGSKSFGPEALEKLARLAKYGRYKDLIIEDDKIEAGGKAVSKTMSVRMDRENYEFLHKIAKEQGTDLSKAVRDTVTRGRILLAVERYKKGEASLGKAAELAGLPVGQMMTILTEFGVEIRLEKEDYLEGLKNLQKIW